MQRLLLIFLTLLIGLSTMKAQAPYRWVFSSKKLSENVYEIHCAVSVQSPWHTYSQFTPVGGPVPTKFIFAKNPLYKTDGVVKENGKLIVKHESVFGVDVKYFEDGVDFVQLVTLKGNVKTNFSGSVEFMVCNDQQCLPPVTQKFSLALN